MIRWLTALAASSLVLAACGGGGNGTSAVEPTGPPEIERAAVEGHAEQFATDLAGRAAGSQEELAAGTYLLGHLQQAGYVVRLEAVPVGDLVASTDVEALPPDGGDPEVLVTVPYDTSGREGASPEALGLFLELARALRVAVPSHSVGFVALGAEFTDRGGGQLGSRRLAKLLTDEGASPLVISLDLLGEGDAAVGGPDAGGLRAAADELGIELSEAPEPAVAAVFRRAGLPHAYAAGDALEVGRVLFGFLSM